MALLAELFEGGSGIMVGEARYIVDAGDAETCELAIAVADDWQARGIARVLLDLLERQAAASGMRRMVADTLLANRGMISLARRAGYAVRASHKDRGLARLEKRLAPLRPEGEEYRRLGCARGGMCVRERARSMVMGIPASRHICQRP